MKENDRNLSILTKIASEGRDFFQDEIWIRNLQMNSEMLKNLSIFVENENVDRIFGACGAWNQRKRPQNLKHLKFFAGNPILP